MPAVRTLPAAGAVRRRARLRVPGVEPADAATRVQRGAAGARPRRPGQAVLLPAVRAAEYRTAGPSPRGAQRAARARGRVAGPRLPPGTASAGAVMTAAELPAETLLSRRLRELEARIAASESTGIQARWEFGRALLAQRVGKQLPAGLLAQVCADVGVSRSELQKRMRLAERYPTEQQVRNAVAQFGSWHRIVADALHDPPPRR